MQGITFSRINTKAFNIILCIVLLLVTIVSLSDYAISLAKFDVKWLLSMEFLKLIFILMCYAVPLTYFLSKAFELTAIKGSLGSSVFAFIATCVLLLPLAFVGLVVFAKLSFAIPIILTITVTYAYVRSLRFAAIRA